MAYLALIKKRGTLPIRNRGIAKHPLLQISKAHAVSHERNTYFLQEYNFGDFRLQEKVNASKMYVYLSMSLASCWFVFGLHP